MTARLLALSALVLILSSCASLRKERAVFVPPSVDCGIYEPPKVDTPHDPKPGEKDVALWQFYALGWQAYAEHVLMQRLDTAECMAAMREAGIVK